MNCDGSGVVKAILTALNDPPTFLVGMGDMIGLDMRRLSSREIAFSGLEKLWKGSAGFTSGGTTIGRCKKLGMLKRSRNNSKSYYYCNSRYHNLYNIIRSKKKTVHKKFSFTSHGDGV